MTKRAQIILDADRSDGKKLEDAVIAERLHMTITGVQNIRKKFYIERMKALEDKPRSGRPSIIDGEIETKIIAIACSKHPKGHVNWTMRMLADRAVELEIVEFISHVTVYTQ